jgi:hypothetical protein
MRLMMQSLLADRFKLAVHVESRQLPVYVLVLDKPGKLGPQLKPHPDDVPCPPTPSPHPSGPAPAPFCNALRMWPVNDQWHARMMALTMEQIADHLVTPIGTGWGELDHRPALDQTGLRGIAEEHGGSVCVDQSNGERTVFTSSLTKNRLIGLEGLIAVAPIQRKNIFLNSVPDSDHH